MLLGIYKGEHAFEFYVVCFKVIRVVRSTVCLDGQ